MSFVRSWSLKTSLRTILRGAVTHYDEKPRAEWLFDYCAQLALVYSQILWAVDVSDAFSKMQEGNEAALKDLYKKTVRTISHEHMLTRMIIVLRH